MNNINHSNRTTSLPNTPTSIPVDIPAEAAFSIMFVSVGMSCFIWQSIRSGWMLYMVRKPIHAIVFVQAVLGVIVTFVTLLASLVEMDCNFRLFFSVVGVNLGDIALQIVLIWKAYVGNDSSKAILFFGSISIAGLVLFIILNLTIGRSFSFYHGGVCMTEYRYLASYLIIKQLKYGRHHCSSQDVQGNGWEYQVSQERNQPTEESGKRGEQPVSKEILERDVLESYLMESDQRWLCGPAKRPATHCSHRLEGEEEAVAAIAFDVDSPTLTNNSCVRWSSRTAPLVGSRHHEGGGDHDNNRGCRHTVHNME
ncbi:hypothetical protein EC973_001509 [Apophysomyces ossiformis]|uniref:Uncharacterized protein n=1 Tax=Apophysomyces ossiformis TaxID=679940 RepID=A0A8H7BK85_9FUNG|nr:hypothetical protein EC973_001509 [Apophysomyces ossiformis]